jgi:hypothetical protein
MSVPTKGQHLALGRRCRCHSKAPAAELVVARNEDSYGDGFVKGMHSHYETLSVARDAPQEVIRAAYKALSQKWHPDKNPSAEATKIMLELNVAYAELCEPGKRARYDQWLHEQEIALARSRPQAEPQRAAAPHSSNTTANRSRPFVVDWDAVIKLQRQQKRKYGVTSKDSFFALLKAIALIVIVFAVVGQLRL